MKLVRLKRTIKRYCSRPTFEPSQLLDLAGFAEKLHSGSEPTSRYLRGQLSIATQKALDDFVRRPPGNTSSLGHLLAEDLTRVLRGECIYEPSRFQRVQFRPETQVLLTATPQGDHTLRLNRLLLEDAYPGELSKTLRQPFIEKLYKWMGQHRLFSTLIGRTYARSPEAIEIDITYACNLRCFNCNRSCTQAPSRDTLGLEQVSKFIEESVEQNVCWKKIHVMGGEPTLHPQLQEILQLLLEYKRRHNPGVELKLVTNGFGALVEAGLARVPGEIVVVNTSKTGPVQEFDPFNVAPRDRLLNILSDYTQGCIIASHCGMGLTPWGYYCCAIAGAIDRIFGHDLGRKHLPPTDDRMLDQMRVFCRLCGHFNREWQASTTRPRQSRTWRRAYAAYKAAKPELSRY